MGSQLPTNSPQNQYSNSQQSLPSLPGSFEAADILPQLRAIFGLDNQHIYLVGGAVRDIILGRSVKDLDFVIPNGAINLAYQVADRLGVPAYVLDKERDSGRIVLRGNNNYLDITSFRGPDLKSDLFDRDFTINAMALPITADSVEAAIDPCGGLSHLANRVIDQTHKTAIVSDPVRALRAIRLALELNFTISEETSVAIVDAAPIINNSSIERLRDELLKMLNLSQPDEALDLLKRMGMLNELLPEIAKLEDVEQGAPHHENVLAHTRSTLRHLVEIEGAILENDEFSDERLGQVSKLLSNNAPQIASHLSRPIQGGVDGLLLLRLGAIFHDVGKAETRLIDSHNRIRFFGHAELGSNLTNEAFRRLKMSNEASRHVSKTVAGHMRPLLLAREPKLTKRAVYRFFRDLGTSGLDCCLHSLADHLAIYPDPSADGHWLGLITAVHRLVDYYFGRYEASKHDSPLLNGNELIDMFDIAPGPQIGILLEMVQEAQATGVVNTKEEAINLVRRALQNP